MIRVLAMLADGVEETELVAPVDLLRRAGVEVTMAAPSGAFEVTGKNGIVLKADLLWDDITPDGYDALFVPGGPAVMELRKDDRVVDLLRSYAARGRPIAAICAAPLLLADAGILDGRTFTAHFSTRDELPAARLDEEVVLDGKILTSRGAGTAVAFGLALVALLVSQEKASEVGEAIMI